VPAKSATEVLRVKSSRSFPESCSSLKQLLNQRCGHFPTSHPGNPSSSATSPYERIMLLRGEIDGAAHRPPMGGLVTELVTRLPGTGVTGGTLRVIRSPVELPKRD
jgi:hypothetical protein